MALGKFDDFVAYLVRKADDTLAKVKDQSILAKIMTKGGDISRYDDDTMSLEAIAEMLGGAAIQTRVEQSISGPVEEGARQQFAISIYDIDTGAVASGSIDISSITQTMEKSTGGAAFSASGITQPGFATAAGLVSDEYTFEVGEWAVGDVYKLTVSGITATVGGDTAYIKAMVWSNVIHEVAEMKADIDTIIATLGALDTAAATGAVTNTDEAMAYIKQLVTELQALDVVADNIYASVLSMLVDYLAHGTWGLAAIRSALQLVQTSTDSILGNVLSIIVDYLGHGTWGLAPIRAALQLVQTDADQIDANVLSILQDYLYNMKSYLVPWGQISAVSGNTFTSSQLAGLGIDAMHGWYVYVMQADDAAPEGEYRGMTDYTDAGVVSHEAFSTALAIGDRVQLIHPVLYHTFAATRGSGARSLETLGQDQDAIPDIAQIPTSQVCVVGTIHTLSDLAITATLPFWVEGIELGMENLAAGDIVTWRVELDHDDASTLQGTADPAWTFGGVQTPTRVYMPIQRWVTYEIAVKVVQSAGSARTVDAVLTTAKRGS